jgi:DnaJ homolog subfamily C member 7
VFITGRGASQRAPLNMSDSAKAEQFKQRGNAYYKEEEYQEAIRFYTQAISLCPTEGSYYGNRSAAWLMMKEYKRCVADCVEGIKYEETPGQLDKLRQRHASALAANGAFEEAVAVLEAALALEGRTGNVNMVAVLEQQLEKLKQAGVHVEGGTSSLAKGEYSRAKRLFQNAQSCGLSDAPVVLLGLGKACLGLEDFEEASRCAQKVIVAGGQVSIDAYTIRADALQATGCTELAQKHLMAALQLDPDNSELQVRVKALRKTVSETARIRDLIDKAMNARKYDEAVRYCGEGMQIDRNVKKLMAEFHSRRAKAYSMLAKVQLRGGHAAAAPQDGASASAAAEENDPQAQSQATYRRCLQDATASIYYDSSEAALPAIFLKCEALQALDRHQEALDTVSNKQSKILFVMSII